MGGYEQQMAAAAAGYGISLGMLIASSVMCAVFFFSFRIPEIACRILARKQRRSGAGRKEKRRPESLEKGILLSAGKGETEALPCADPPQAEPAKDSLKSRTEDLKGDFRILEQIEVIHSDEFI